MEGDESYETEFQNARKRRLSRVQTGDFINPFDPSLSNKQNDPEKYLDENRSENTTEITIDEKDRNNVRERSELPRDNPSYPIVNFSRGSKTPFWEDLRRKILLDLQRHFKRKVDHDRLISSLCKLLSF